MTWSFLINELNWSRRVEAYLTQPITVFKEALTNNHYEGDVKGKASLKIRSFGELSYGDYTGIGLESSWWQTLTETEQQVNVDQVKYTNFQVPDPDQTTTEANLVEEGSMKLAYQISRITMITSLRITLRSPLISTARPEAMRGLVRADKAGRGRLS